LWIDRPREDKRIYERKNEERRAMPGGGGGGKGGFFAGPLPSSFVPRRGPRARKGEPP